MSSRVLKIRGSDVVVHDASFVDDVVSPMVSDAPDLGQKVSKVSSIAISIFGMIGLSINSSAGKTEVSVSLRGSYSKQIRRNLANDGDTIKVNHKHGSISLSLS